MGRGPDQSSSPLGCGENRRLEVASYLSPTCSSSHLTYVRSRDLCGIPLPAQSCPTLCPSACSPSLSPSPAQSNQGSIPHVFDTTIHICYAASYCWSVLRSSDCITASVRGPGWRLWLLGRGQETIEAALWDATPFSFSALGKSRGEFKCRGGKDRNPPRQQLAAVYYSPTSPITSCNDKCQMVQFR